MDEDIKKAFFDEMQERFNNISEENKGKDKKNSWYIMYSIGIAALGICSCLLYLGAKIAEGRQVFVVLSGLPSVVKQYKASEDSTHTKMYHDFYSSISELRNEFITYNRNQNQDLSNRLRAYKNDTIQIHQP